MGADYSFDLKNIEIWAPEFFKHNNSSVATERYKVCTNLCSEVKQTAVLLNLNDKVISFTMKFRYLSIYNREDDRNSSYFYLESSEDISRNLNAKPSISKESNGKMLVGVKFSILQNIDKSMSAKSF